MIRAIWDELSIRLAEIGRRAKSDPFARSLEWSAAEWRPLLGVPEFLRDNVHCYIMMASRLYAVRVIKWAAEVRRCRS